MSDVVMTLVHNVVTNEVIERPATASEKSDLLIGSNESKAIEIERNSLKKARESALAKLADLGLTAEEIAAL
jgi:hypothetical protein